MRARSLRWIALSSPALLPFAFASACGGSTPPVVAPAPSTSVSASISTYTSTSTTSSASAISSLDDPAPVGRLPRDLRPEAARLSMSIVPSEPRFSGSIDLDVALSQARSVVWMHGRGLHVSRAQVTTEDGATIAATFAEVNESGVASLRPERPIPVGKATIHLEWDGALGHKLEGLFGVEVTHGAVKEHYAFTQLEAISARKMFPCFDEPYFKVPYELTIATKNGDLAIANTIETKRETVGDETRFTFARTQPLPSYLIAMAVGPLDVVEGPTLAPSSVRPWSVPFRGVAVKGRGKDLAYALAHAPRMVTELEAYTGVAYPFDKLDLIANPDQGGAMENPGAITFSEWLLLVDEKTAPISQLRAFRSVTAHELAHIWFGDLVTTAWWDDVWLNEAMATWMSAKIVEKIAPEDHAEVARVDRMQAAMGADALVSGRKIRQPIESNDDIANAFDSITYQKGAAVLAMFEKWMGAAKFQAGIHEYLGAHRFGTSDASGFLSALSKGSGFDVSTPFTTFLEQVGVPMVDVKLSCENDDRKLVLSQTRFLPLGSAGDGKRAWGLPVCVRVPVDVTERGSPKPKQVDRCLLLDHPVETLALDVDKCPNWVMPNADGVGYFRFGLSHDELDRLGDAARSVKGAPPELDEAERISFANAVRAGLRRGSVRWADGLRLLTPLAHDAWPSVAMEAAGQLGDARDALWDEPGRAKAEAKIASIYRPIAAQLGWSAKAKETPESGLLRRDVLRALALDARDPATRAEAARRGRAYVGGAKDTAVHRDAVDANLTGLALIVAVQEGDEAFFDRVLARVAATTDSVVRGALIDGLAHVEKPALVARALALALDSRIKTSETWWLLGPLGDRPASRDATWAWVQEHFDALAKRLPRSSIAGLPSVAESYCDEAHASAIKAFFQPRLASMEGGPRRLETTLESMSICVAYRAKHRDGMRDAVSAK